LVWSPKITAEARALRRGFLRGTTRSLIALVAAAALLFTVEGLASIRMAFRAPGDMPLKERAHTEFDRDLGWINERNAHALDLYGPGRHLTTNSERFRSRRDFTRSIPKGTVRAICTGDSFTLGYGVGDADPWCELLSRRDARLETINMG
jgi:hypothetical protein